MEMMIIGVWSVVLPCLMLVMVAHMMDGVDTTYATQHMIGMYTYIKGSKMGMWVREYSVEMGIWCVGMLFIAVVTLIVPVLL